MIFTRIIYIINGDIRRIKPETLDELETDLLNMYMYCILYKTDKRNYIVIVDKRTQIKKRPTFYNCRVENVNFHKNRKKIRDPKILRYFHEFNCRLFTFIYRM